MQRLHLFGAADPEIPNTVSKNTDITSHPFRFVLLRIFNLHFLAGSCPVQTKCGFSVGGDGCGLGKGHRSTPPLTQISMLF